jgi:DNA-binding transcriptional MerR regulator
MMEIKRLYPTKEMLEITGETRPRIQYWILNGIISPLDPSTGTGTTRRFSFENLLEVMITKALSNSRIDIKIIANLVKQIRRERSDFFKKHTYEKNENNQLVLAVDIFSQDSTFSAVSTFKEVQKRISGMLKRGNLVIMLNLDILKSILIEKLEQKRW